MAPEYAMHGNFSMKSDVYSFGVLTLEILSGKRSNGFDNEADQNVENLVNYVSMNILLLVNETSNELKLINGLGILH